MLLSACERQEYLSSVKHAPEPPSAEVEHNSVSCFPDRPCQLQSQRVPHHLSLCAVSSFPVIKRTHLKVYACSTVPFAFSHPELSVASPLAFYPRDSSHPASLDNALLPHHTLFSPADYCFPHTYDGHKPASGLT